MPLAFEGYALQVVVDQENGDRMLVFVDRNTGSPSHIFRFGREEAVQTGYDLIGAENAEQAAQSWAGQPEDDVRVPVAADEPTTVPENWVPDAQPGADLADAPPPGGDIYPGPGAGEIERINDLTAEAAELDRQERTAPHGDAVLPPPPVETHDPYPPPYVPEEIAEEDEPEQPES